MVRHLLCIVVFVIPFQLCSQTGIGTTTPHASAKLEVAATNKGFLPPRMTSTQRQAISSPATGLLVYQTDGTSGLYYYNGSGWIYIINSTSNVLSVANGGTGVASSTGAGNNVLSNSPTIETPTISSGNIQYPTSLNVLPTTHATSKRAAIWLDNWGILQDFNGDGTKNLSITQNYSNTYPTRFFINTNGNIGIGTSTPTETLDVSGNVKATNFIGSGSQLTDIANRTTGSWNVTTGNNNYSFTVSAGSYVMWVYANIPNGIIAWNATVSVTNSNVPVVGSQYAWVYNGGGTPIDFTSIPNQITGTNNAIIRSTISGSTSNTFTFGINNTSGAAQTVYYGYIRL